MLRKAPRRPVKATMFRVYPAWNIEQGRKEYWSGANEMKASEASRHTPCSRFPSRVQKKAIHYDFLLIFDDGRKKNKLNLLKPSITPTYIDTSQGTTVSNLWKQGSLTGE